MLLNETRFDFTKDTLDYRDGHFSVGKSNKCEKMCFHPQALDEHSPLVSRLLASKSYKFTSFRLFDEVQDKVYLMPRDCDSDV